MGTSVLNEIKKNNKLNVYQNNKLLFLEDNNFSENTNSQYFNILAGGTIINTLELSKEKDLYDFNLEELTDLISSYPTTNRNTKRFIKYVIGRYLDYAIERGLITTGINLTTLISDECFNVSDNILKNKYIELSDFYDELSTYKESTYVDLMILVLLRYGLTVNEISNLKIKDVDINNKQVLICDEYNNVIKRLPIDEMFLKYYNLCIDCDEFNGKSYQDNGYLIKPLEVPSRKATKMNDTSIRSRLQMISDYNNVPRPSISILNMSRKYDILIDIYNQNGKLTIFDIQKVIELFEIKCTNSKLYSLKTKFEEMFGIKVVRKNKKSNKN